MCEPATVAFPALALLGELTAQFRGLKVRHLTQFGPGVCEAALAAAEALAGAHIPWLKLSQQKTKRMLT